MDTLRPGEDDAQVIAGILRNSGETSRSKVRQVIDELPNKFTKTDVVMCLGDTSDKKLKKQVDNALYSMRVAGAISRTGRGSYQKTPEGTPEMTDTSDISYDIMEVVGRTKGGKLVLRDGANVIYVAEAL